MGRDLSSNRKIIHRSPPYPSTNLEDAVYRAQILYNNAGEEWVPLPKIFNYVNYKEDISEGSGPLSSMRQYGLVKVRGRRKLKEYRISELGKDILEKRSSHSKTQATLLAECALKPKIFKRLWERYLGKKLPQESSFRQVLINEYRFNPERVGIPAASFKSTMEYAGLLMRDRIIKSIAATKDLQSIESKKNEELSVRSRSVTKPNQDPIKPSQALSVPDAIQRYTVDLAIPNDSRNVLRLEITFDLTRIEK